MTPWHQYLMGAILIIAGTLHFLVPKVYMRIMPPYIPSPRIMVMLSGVAEMWLGVMLLIPNMQTLAAFGIILMLFVFFPVHIYMIKDKKAASGLPKWFLILRIPMQIGLILWAYLYV